MEILGTLGAIWTAILGGFLLGYVVREMLQRFNQSNPTPEEISRQSMDSALLRMPLHPLDAPIYAVEAPFTTAECEAAIVCIQYFRRLAEVADSGTGLARVWLHLAPWIRGAEARLAGAAYRARWDARAARAGRYDPTDWRQ